MFVILNAEFDTHTYLSVVLAIAAVMTLILMENMADCWQDKFKLL